MLSHWVGGRGPKEGAMFPNQRVQTPSSMHSLGWQKGSPGEGVILDQQGVLDSLYNFFIIVIVVEEEFTLFYGKSFERIRT